MVKMRYLGLFHTPAAPTLVGGIAEDGEPHSSDLTPASKPGKSQMIKPGFGAGSRPNALTIWVFNT